MSRSHRRRLGALLTSLLLLAAAAPAAHATFPGADGRLAWAINASTIDQETRAITGRTVHRTDAFSFASCVSEAQKRCPALTGPAFSAGGTSLAFVEAARSIDVVHGDGSDPHTLVTAFGLGDVADPAWSPRGARIALTIHADRARGSALGLVSRRTRTVRQLIARGRWPAWSSANRIAFTRGARCTSTATPPALGYACHGGHLDVVAPNGRGLRRLTRGEGERPDWSPKATRIAFIRRGDVYVLVLRSGRVTRVTRDAGATGVVWSPDGADLALYGPGDRGWGQITVVRARDGHQIAVPAAGRSPDPEQGDGGSQVFEHPSWQPRPMG